MPKFKKKYTLTWAAFLAGFSIAVTTGAELGEWSAFVAIVLAAFGAADVTDKKLNGGHYDATREDRGGRVDGQDS